MAKAVVAGVLPYEVMIRLGSCARLSRTGPGGDGSHYTGASTGRRTRVNLAFGTQSGTTVGTIAPRSDSLICIENRQLWNLLW
jgi:hypothetical protein